jgi:hypothetical protein
MATEKITIKNLKLYAEDRFYEVFGNVDDFETENEMLRQEFEWKNLKTKEDVEELLERLLEVYKDNYEDWQPEPKAWSK